VLYGEGRVNDETNKKRPEIDFADYSDEELEGIIADIERELEDRKERQKSDALEKMKEVAEKVGMTPEELLGLGVARKKKRRVRRAKKKG
jgi:DNA-binding protein H-NS